MNPPPLFPTTRSQSSSALLAFRSFAVPESWAELPLRRAIVASSTLRLTTASKSMLGNAWGRVERRAEFMSFSVAVLRIWTHPDIEISSHSSGERFRGDCFPLGRTRFSLPDSGIVWIRDTSIRLNSYRHFDSVKHRPHRKGSRSVIHPEFGLHRANMAPPEHRTRSSPSELLLTVKGNIPDRHKTLDDLRLPRITCSGHPPIPKKHLGKCRPSRIERPVVSVAFPESRQA